MISMNTQVTATGMKVKAQAEGGIVISNESQALWKASADASHVIENTTLKATELIPTSTASLTSWYHAVSDDANNYAKATSTAYTTYTKTSETAATKITETDGVGLVTMGDTSKGIYLVNKFYIQSSAGAITLGDAGLYINSVTATTTTTNTTNLNKALRVAISITDSAQTVMKFFAPVEGGQTTYAVNGTSFTVVAAGVKNTTTGLKNIPAYAADGSGAIEASIFIYFEGEDENCKSANLNSIIDTLDVQVVFGTTAIS